MKSEKGISAKDALGIDLKNKLTMKDTIPTKKKFQYLCSFCWRELPSGGIRFNGIGACPLHLMVAQKLIEGLREYELSYFNNFRGGRK